MIDFWRQNRTSESEVHRRQIMTSKDGPCAERVKPLGATTVTNIGSSKRTLQYYYHPTPGEPFKGSPGVAW